MLWSFAKKRRWILKRLLIIVFVSVFMMTVYCQETNSQVNRFLNVLKDEDMKATDLQTWDNTLEELESSISNRMGWDSWFNEMFLPEFQDAEPIFNEGEKEELERILKIKPTYDESGQYFIIFLREYFSLIKDIKPIMNENERYSLKLFLKAIPGKQGSESSYTYFLKEFDVMFDDALPVVNDSEKEFLDFAIRACPSGNELGFEKWMELYNKYYDDFKPTITEKEAQLLDLLEKIKPEEETQSEVVKVEKENIYRIMRLIKAGNTEEALYRLQMILEQ